MAFTITKMGNFPVNLFERPAFFGDVEGKLTVVGGTYDAKAWQSADGNTWAEVDADNLVNSHSAGSGFYKFGRIFIAGGFALPGSQNKIKVVKKSVAKGAGGFRFRRAGSMADISSTNAIYNPLFIPLERKGFIYFREPHPTPGQGIIGTVYWKEDMTKGGKAYSKATCQILYERGPAWVRDETGLIVFARPTGSTDPRHKLYNTHDGFNFFENPNFVLPFGATQVNDAATAFYQDDFWFIGGTWNGGACCGTNKSFVRINSMNTGNYTSFDFNEPDMSGYAYHKMKACVWNGSMWVVAVQNGTDGAYNLVYKATQS